MRLPTPILRFAGRAEPRTFPDPAPPKFVSFAHHLSPFSLLLAIVLMGGLLLVGLGRAGAEVAAMPPVAQSLGNGAAVTSAAYCENLMVNSGFESQTGWVFSGVESPPEYATDRAYQGNWSMRTGIVGTNNVASISAVQQTLDIPDFTETLSLKLRYWPIGVSASGNDLQYIDIYNAYNNQFIRRVWYDTGDMAVRDMDGDGDTDQLDIQATEWLFLSTDLTDIKSVTNRIRIFFAVTNDGASPVAALYLDNVELVACDSDLETTTPTPTPSPTGSATPTPRTPSRTPSSTPSLIPTSSATPVNSPTVTLTHTPTPIPGDTATPTQVPSATPAPTGCVDVVLNGNFESNDYWVFGADPYASRYVSEPGQGGARSVRLGTPPGADVPTVVTYSSIRQLITIPSTSASASLTYRIKYRTDQAQDELPSNVSDRQETILLNPDLSTLAIKRRVLRNRDNWEQETIDLTEYVGDSFYLYFNVYNDGNGARTWAFLDDVALSICYPPSATSTMTPAVSPTVPSTVTTPTVAPTLTPTLTSTVGQTPEATATPSATTMSDDAPVAAQMDGSTTDLEDQANRVATVAAGTATTVPNLAQVGIEEPTSSRMVTRENQVTPTLEAVSPPRPGGVSFQNLSGFTVMLLVIGGFLVLALIILGIARSLGGRRGHSGPP